MDTLKDRFVLTFTENKRVFLASIFCFGGVVCLGIHFLIQPGPESYAKAEAAYQTWRENDDDASYAEMRKALKKVPTLQKKYIGAIAQKLFQKNRLSDALELANTSIKALDDAPFHSSYAQMSLLIKKGEYQKALEQSVSLKETMLKACDLQKEVGGHSVGGGLLYAHNLLRIACLHQELHNQPGEKASLEDLENFLSTSASLKRLVFETFRDKGLDLGDYILERKNKL